MPSGSVFVFWSVVIVAWAERKVKSFLRSKLTRYKQRKGELADDSVGSRKGITEQRKLRWSKGNTTNRTPIRQIAVKGKP